MASKLVHKIVRGFHVTFTAFYLLVSAVNCPGTKRGQAIIRGKLLNLCCSNVFMVLYYSRRLYSYVVHMYVNR